MGTISARLKAPSTRQSGNNRSMATRVAVLPLPSFVGEGPQAVPMPPPPSLAFPHKGGGNRSCGASPLRGHLNFKQPDADPHSRGAIAPELCKTMTLDNRGRRECRMRSSHPQPRVQDKKAHERSHHRYTAISRHSLRDGFTAYSVLSPVTGLFCHRRSPRELLP
jgi:hypothetical protein